MTTSKDSCNQILELLEPLGDFTVRPMMGEFLLYYHGVLVGGIYDNRLLIKKSESNTGCNLPEEIPYATAKRTMYHITNFNDLDHIQTIITNVYSDLRK